MVPFGILAATFAVLLVFGRHRWPWYVSLRIALAAMFAVTAWAHFGSMRDDLVRMVPPMFPRPELIVTLTGIAEILGAIGLLIPRAAMAAAWCLAVLMFAMFPANVHAALAGVTLDGKPPTPLVLRSVLQLLFVAALVAAAMPERLNALVHRRVHRSRPGLDASSRSA